MLALVRLEHLAGRYPREMSGGQQQRVALARALAVRPSILLLDEPFAALDKNLRLDMQIEIKRIQRSAGTTTLIVTHDQEEALSMADRVAVLNAGRLEQFAPPTDVYDRPETLFVNTFVGTANVLHGRLATGPGAPAWWPWRPAAFSPPSRPCRTGRGWPPACGPSTSPSRPEGRGSTAWSRSACRSAPPWSTRSASTAAPA